MVISNLEVSVYIYRHSLNYLTATPGILSSIIFGLTAFSSYYNNSDLIVNYNVSKPMEFEARHQRE
jgi:hypothetical protein